MQGKPWLALREFCLAPTYVLDIYHLTEVIIKISEDRRFNDLQTDIDDLM